jgi:hypothetical protein
MTSFSAPQTYSITSSDTLTIDTSTWANLSAAAGSLDTITISNGGNYTSSAYMSGMGVTSIGGLTSSGNISSINISGGAGTGFSWTAPEEFVNCLPDFDRIKKMCEEYPGLKIAYEKFVTTYKLVKDHYDTPEDQRPNT